MYLYDYAGNVINNKDMFQKNIIVEYGYYGEANTAFSHIRVNKKGMMNPCNSHLFVMIFYALRLLN